MNLRNYGFGPHKNLRQQMVRKRKIYQKIRRL
jgi:hypothetical protein